MPPKPKQRVHATDGQGRPTDVTFTGDSALQCPACLSDQVESIGAVGFVPVGDSLNPDAPVRRMRCRACGGRWWRPGL
jgi:hypothetical protein